jgi:hypothetical protein
MTDRQKQPRARAMIVIRQEPSGLIKSPSRLKTSRKNVKKKAAKHSPRNNTNDNFRSFFRFNYLNHRPKIIDTEGDSNSVPPWPCAGVPCTGAGFKGNPFFEGSSYSTRTQLHVFCIILEYHLDPIVFSEYLPRGAAGIVTMQAMASEWRRIFL